MSLPVPRRTIPRWPIRVRAALALTVPALITGLGCTTTGLSADIPAVPDEATRAGSSGAGRPTQVSVERLLDGRSLDGSGNNLDDPALGQAGSIYPRETAANYADGVGEPVDGPDARYLSNRIFNDTNQNVFSENGVTHWSFVWGQFIDHTIGLRETGDEDFPIGFDADDPLESFTNDLGEISMTRSAVAAGTGDGAPREQVNTLSSYIDAWAVYGGSAERLDWLRDGEVDGDPSNNSATLLDVDGYLPTAAARPGVEAPSVDLMGRLFADPSAAVIAGDVRVNENIGLTAVQTLFLREHNRIVESLPADLDEEAKFAVARRVVGALQQYITYTEFLPAMGVELPAYEGYDPAVDPSITNEFATVGYRAHSQIHGEFEAEIDRSTITDAALDALAAQGVEVTLDENTAEVAVPLGVAFGNPGLLTEIGLGSVLAGLASEAAYANDEQIDNQLRSVLFQVPGPEVENPLDCLDGTEIAGCFTVVNDLGAIDVMRGYDHGMPTYNDLRDAYGLERVTSFAELTGEATDEFPDDPAIDASNPIDDPDVLDFVALLDADGNPVDPGSDLAATSVVSAVRRTTTAARLRAVFTDVDAVDAFTGMVAEPHVAGAEFGELQLAMWTRQFAALRDGDRFFYGNDPVLDEIAETYGIEYRRSLADVIAANTDADRDDLPANVFLLAPAATVSADAADAQDTTPSEAGDRPGRGPERGRPDDDRGDRPHRDRPPRPRPDDRRARPGDAGGT